MNGSKRPLPADLEPAREFLDALADMAAQAVLKQLAQDGDRLPVDGK